MCGYIHIMPCRALARSQSVNCSLSVLAHSGSLDLSPPDSLALFLILSPRARVYEYAFLLQKSIILMPHLRDIHLDWILQHIRYVRRLAFTPSVCVCVCVCVCGSMSAMSGLPLQPKISKPNPRRRIDHEFV